MDLSVNFGPEWKNLQRFLALGIERPAERVVRRVAGFAENRMGLNANRLVYSYTPKTDSYKRKGRLLGGRGSSLSGGKPAKEVLDNLAVKLTADPRLKGARINYAPFVNDGTDRMPARPFFDVTVEETQKEAPKLAGEEIAKYLAKGI